MGDTLLDCSVFCAPTITARFFGLLGVFTAFLSAVVAPREVLFVFFTPAVTGFCEFFSFEYFFDCAAWG